MATKELYDLAKKYYQTKLWHRLSDADVFAVSFPNGTIGYCSVMGRDGVFNALAVFTDGQFQSYMDIYEEERQSMGFEGVEVGLRQDCIMVIFSEEEYVHPNNLAEIESYGLKFPKKAMVDFVTHHPYMLNEPITRKIDENKIYFALHAALAVAKAIEKDTSVNALANRSFKPFVAVPLLVPQSDGSFEWKEIPWPKYDRHQHPRVILTAKQSKGLAAIKPKQNSHLCIAQALIPVVVKRSIGNGYFYPHAILAYEVNSQYILPPALCEATGDENIAQALIEQLLGAIRKEKPARISVRESDDRTYYLVEDLCRKAKIPLDRFADEFDFGDIVDNFKETIEEESQYAEDEDAYSRFREMVEENPEMLDALNAGAIDTLIDAYLENAQTPTFDIISREDAVEEEEDKPAKSKKPSKPKGKK